MQRILRACFSLAALALASRWALGADESLEAWMPDDVIGYVKLTGAGERVEQFLSSDLRKEIESFDAVKVLLARSEYKKFLRGVEDFKTSTGKEPLKLFQELLGKDVLVGARLAFGGPEVIVLSRTAGAKALEDGLKTVKGAIEQNGVFLQYTESTHGDRKIETIADKVSHASVGAVWIASNSTAAIERVIDLAQGKSDASVKKSAIFSKAAPAHLKGALASLAVRPQFIPNYNIPEKADNALASLLFGGWLAGLDASELLTASLGVEDEALDLKISSLLGEKAKNDKGWEKYASFFPETIPDGVRQRLEKRGVLTFTELHRNLAHWWQHREELLETKAAGELIEFSNIMSIVFGGRNFQDEVLPDIGPVITIVSRNQEYKKLPEKPQPAIPGFAAVFQLKSAKDSGDDMVAAFYTLIGIINADRAQKKKEGGMAMIPKPEKVGDVDMHTVSLNTSMAAKDAKPGMMHNFTPSMAVVGSRVVLSSSSEIARILVEELVQEGEPKTGVSKSADTITVEGEAVHSILSANRDVLVADTMMKKGTAKAQAEGEIQLLLDIVKRVRDLRVESARNGDSLDLRLKLSTQLGAGSAGKEGGKKTAEVKKGAKL